MLLHMSGHHLHGFTFVPMWHNAKFLSNCQVPITSQASNDKKPGQTWEIKLYADTSTFDSLCPLPRVTELFWACLRGSVGRALDSWRWESGFEMLRHSIYETPDWDGPVGGSSRGQLVSWVGQALLGFDKHAKLLILNYPNNPELPDHMVGARAWATSTV